jgi:hypothetical protein
MVACRLSTALDVMNGEIIAAFLAARHGRTPHWRCMHGEAASVVIVIALAILSTDSMVVAGPFAVERSIRLKAIITFVAAKMYMPDRIIRDHERVK